MRQVNGVTTVRQGTSDDAPNEGSANKTCNADSLRVATWPCSRPHLGPAPRWLPCYCISGLRSAGIKLVLNIYFTLCVHGFRRAVCFNSLSAGLCLIVLPCVILPAIFCSSLLCLVLPPLSSVGPPGGSGGNPVGIGILRFRKTLVFFAALRPAGRESNGKIRGNFSSRLQNFPSANLSIFRFRKFFWPLGHGASSSN